MQKRDWRAGFQDQCRRSLARSVEDRMRYGFCYVYKPVLDDAPWRSFDSDIIASKRAARRPRDLIELPLLEAFREVYEKRPG